MDGVATGSPLADAGIVTSTEKEAPMAPLGQDPLAPQAKMTQVGFKGGLPVDLTKKMKNGRTLEENLKESLFKDLDREIENHRERIEAIGRWNKLYSGVRPAKSYPYAGANNIAIPFTMYHVDAITVRIMDAIWSQKKLFIITGRQEPFVGMARKLEDGIDWWQKDMAHLKQKLFSPIQQAIKVGTSFVKLDYKEERHVRCRYAKPEEVAAQLPGVFQFGNGEWGLKDVVTSYSGPDIYSFSREDAVWTTSARTIQEARLFGFRTYKYKNEIVAASLPTENGPGQYPEGIVDKLGATDEIDRTKVDRADDAKLEIKPTESGQYAIWEVYYKFDVDEDGQEDDLVISCHRNSKTIMSAIYNQIFSGYRPIVRIVFNPMEFAIEGKGTVEILEGIQNGIDFYHNARLDRLDQINNPVYLIQAGANLDEFVHAPGSKWITEALPKDAIAEFVGNGSMFPPSIQEEQMLNTYGEKAAGASPAIMGQSVSERPVARETIALIQEANKKFKFGIDNLRDCIAEIGTVALELFAQFQPTYQYFVNQGATLQSQTIDFPLDYIRDGCKVELTASSEMLNTEVRQQVGLTAYQLLSDYYTKTAGMLQAIVSPGPSPAFKKYLMTVMAVGGNLLRGILEDLGLHNSETLIPAFEKDKDILNEAVQSTLMALNHPEPPPGNGGGNGQEQGGPPGEGGPPQEGPPQGEGGPPQ